MIFSTVLSIRLSPYLFAFFLCYFCSCIDLISTTICLFFLPSLLFVYLSAQGSAALCTDYRLPSGLSWTDKWGDDCLWYLYEPDPDAACKTCGGTDSYSQGHTAQTACCVCGGGIESNGCTNLDPTPGIAWTDSNGYTCFTYSGSFGSLVCDLYGDMPSDDIPSDGLTANTACCGCGGGCVDLTINGVPWGTGDGSDVTNCDFFISSRSLCYLDWAINPDWVIDGYTPNLACCACGGGVRGGIPPTPCQTCQDGFFDDGGNGGCAGINDLNCRACQTCQDGFFDDGGCEGINDRVCSPCQMCQNGTFPTGGCDGINERM